MHLDLDDVAWVLNDFGDVCFVTATNFPQDSLQQIGEATKHPVFPEDADAEAEWRRVRLDHAKGAVDGPHHEEDDKQVMDGPEALVIGATGFFDGGEDHGHERYQHDPPGPARAGQKAQSEEAHETLLGFDGELGDIVDVGDGVNPGEKDDGVGNELVEGDVLVKWDNAVQWRLSQKGDEGSAYGKEDEGNVEMEDQSC